MAARQPAPQPLRLVEEFVNTTDDDAEDLTSPDALAAWYASHDLLPNNAAATNDDLARALAVREALRSLLLANNGYPLDPAPVAVLNDFTGAAPLLLRFDSNAAAALVPGSAGVDAALARILVVVLESMADGTWERLKTCRSETCEWVFYDSSKNHSAAWCSMRVCGNRQKARRYRSRKRGELAATAAG
jgi:predicted RNA-binding Zn ribbon-like protein